MRRADDPKRMACRTVLDTLFHALVRYAAPVLVFTSEEVWGTRFPEAGSVHLLEWPLVDAAWNDDTLLFIRSDTRPIRRLVTEAIEPLRREKALGSSLEAEVTISTVGGTLGRDLRWMDLAEICIVSKVNLVPNEAPDSYFGDVIVTRSANHKCGRCWRHLPEVTEDGALCSRCDQVVAGMDAAAHV